MTKRADLRYRVLLVEVVRLRVEVERQADALDAFMAEVEAVVRALARQPSEASPPMSRRRTGLGRGLDALIPPPDSDEDDLPVAE